MRKKPGRKAVWPEGMVVSFQTSRQQAYVHNIEWGLTMQDYKDLWGDKWELKGRKPGHYVMRRIDKSKGWVKGNIVLKQCVSKFNTPLGAFDSIDEVVEAHGFKAKQSFYANVRRGAKGWSIG